MKEVGFEQACSQPQFVFLGKQGNFFGGGTVNKMGSC